MIQLIETNPQLLSTHKFRGVNVGSVGGGYTPQTYVSVGLQMSAVGLKI